MALLVRVGNVTFNDANENNLFESQIDSVVDAKGRPLPAHEQSAQLKELLGELKATSWKGILLTRARAYLQYLENARASAKEGEVEETLHWVEKIATPLTGLPLKPDPKELEKLFEQSLKQGIGTGLDRAEKALQKGESIETVLGWVHRSIGYRDRLETSFGVNVVLNKARVDTILVGNYATGIPRLYEEMEGEAEKGDIVQVQRLIEKLHHFSKDAYTEYSMAFVDDTARRDAALLNAYLTGIPLEYKNARKHADRGNVEEMRTSFNDIQAWIGQANQTFQAGLAYDTVLADSILETGLRKGVPVIFEKALESARKKELANTLLLLKSASECADEYNLKFARLPGRKKITFDDSRADGIYLCALREGPCF